MSADRSSRKAKTQGQSTVEFVLSLILFMGFLFFFMKLSYFLAYGNLVQYATFLAARAYQASGPDRQDQEERARVTLVRLLKKSEGEAGTERFQSIAQGFGGGNPTGAQIGAGTGFDATDDAKSWLQGVRYTFRSRLFVSLLGDKPDPASSTAAGPPLPPGVMSLTSESWLSRESTESECSEEVLTTLKGKLDNGC